MGHQHPPAASQARTRRIVNYSTEKSLLAIEGRYHVLVYLHFIYPSRSVYPRVPVFHNKSDDRGQKKNVLYLQKWAHAPPLLSQDLKCCKLHFYGQNMIGPKSASVNILTNIMSGSSSLFYGLRTDTSGWCGIDEGNKGIFFPPT